MVLDEQEVAVFPAARMSQDRGLSAPDISTFKKLNKQTKKEILKERNFSGGHVTKKTNE